jgi:glycine/D-amino acid oxidase-like deaminating enzyme
VNRVGAPGSIRGTGTLEAMMAGPGLSIWKKPVARESEVVIIGSGAFGSSTAYHLAALGHKGVVLIDAHEIASQTSPRAAGLTKQVRSHQDMSRLAMLSVEKFLRFTEELGEPLTYVQSGSVNIARGDGDEAVIRAEIAAGKALGLETYEISFDEMSLLAPLIRPAGIRIIAYTPSDLYLEEPGQLPLGYAQAAQKQGVTLLPNTRVTGIGVQGGRVASVVTDKGEIRARIVIDAAGAWSKLVAEHAKLRIPILPVRHQLYITDPIPGVEVDHAICRIYDACVYMRPHQGGLLLGGYERDPQFHDMHKFPTGFQISDLPLDISVLERLTQSVRAQVLIDDQLPVREHRGGLPTMTPDGLPIIGPVPAIEGFFIASGCCVGGLSISPAVGEMLAGWVHTGQPSPALEAFALSRFGKAYDSDTSLRQACEQQYTGWYSSAPRVTRPR